MTTSFSRRDFLKTSGALIVSFSAASLLPASGTAQIETDGSAYRIVARRAQRLGPWRTTPVGIEAELPLSGDIEHTAPGDCAAEPCPPRRDVDRHIERQEGLR